MKKNIFSAAILLSLSSIGMTANAAEIQFSGTITEASCQLESDNLAFTLPPFGIADVQEAGKNNGAISMTAKVVCDAKAKDGRVLMQLMPNPNSFEGKVLKNIQVAEAAAGVGVVVMGDDGKPLDFSQGVTNISAPMVGGAANIKVAATYAQDGSGDAVTAGKVSAVLPFVITYE